MFTIRRFLKPASNVMALLLASAINSEVFAGPEDAVPAATPSQASPESTPLAKELRRTTDATITPSEEDIAVIAASTIYAGEILSAWNPSYSSDEVVETLTIDILTRGVNAGLLSPLLKILDLSSATNDSSYAALVSPIITRLNPKAGRLLHERLGLPLDLPPSVISNSFGNLTGIRVFLNPALSARLNDRAAAAWELNTRISSGVALGLAGSPPEWAHSIDAMLLGETALINRHTGATVTSLRTLRTNQDLNALGLDSGFLKQPTSRDKTVARGALSNWSSEEVRRCINCYLKVGGASAAGYATGVSIAQVALAPTGPIGEFALGAIVALTMGTETAKGCSKDCSPTSFQTAEHHLKEQERTLIAKERTVDEKIAKLEQNKEEDRKVADRNPKTTTVSETEKANTEARDRARDAELAALRDEKKDIKAQEKSTKDLLRILDNTKKNGSRYASPESDGSDLPPKIAKNVRLLLEKSRDRQFSIGVVEKQYERALIQTAIQTAATSGNLGLPRAKQNNVKKQIRDLKKQFHFQTKDPDLGRGPADPR